MRQRMKIESNQVQQRRRQTEGERPFALIKQVLGMRQFLLRGTMRVKSEWSWIPNNVNLIVLTGLLRDGEKRSRPAGDVFHVLNRAVVRLTIFENPEDYAAFMRVVAETWEIVPLPIYTMVAMPSHWHFVVRPETSDQVSECRNQVRTINVTTGIPTSLHAYDSPSRLQLHSNNSLSICRRGKDINRRKFAFQDRFRFAVEPILDDSRIDLTKICVVPKIAVLKVTETWKFSDQAGLRGGSGDEHLAGGSMVRPLAGVFFYPTTEFTETHHGHPVRML